MEEGLARTKTSGSLPGTGTLGLPAWHSKLLATGLKSQDRGARMRSVGALEAGAIGSSEHEFIVTLGPACAVVFPHFFSTVDPAVWTTPLGSAF